MPVIKLDNFKRQSVSKSLDYTYSDLHLDLQIFNLNTANNIDVVKGKDIIIDFDLSAIKNGLFNLFNTVPGHKLLNPLFGLNIRQYLFEPVSEFVAREIASVVINGIENWEPRVRVVQFNCIAKPDFHQYDIIIVLEIPDLKEFTSIEGILNKDGFIVDRANTKDLS